jgi:hypothetical protein
MARNQHAVLKDLHLVNQEMHVEHPAARGVGHAVAIAPDADHAVVGNPPLP